MTRRLNGLGLAFAAGLALATPALAQEPLRGGVLSFAIAAEPPTYDCHASQTFATIQRTAPHYSTLLAYAQNEYPKVVGDLAESWTVSPDQLTYTFKIFPNVKFHDGTDLTTDDVKATYERVKTPPAGVLSPRSPSLAKVASIETPDAQTIVFKMKEVDASIMSTFASPWNCIYSAAKLKSDSEYPAKAVMGSGPFRFVEHVAGSYWVGERFKDYFRKDRPYLDGFRAITMSSAATLNALEGKQILAEFRGLAPPERDRLARGLGKDIVMQESSWLLHMDVSFNPQKKPFDDVRVRQALSLAIDRYSAATSLGRISPLKDIGGVVRPGGEWATPAAELEKLPGFGRDMAANRAEAKRLLKEAGQENLSFTLLNRNIAPYVATGVFLIDQWRQIGVTVAHQPVETSQWYNGIYGAQYDVVVDSYTDFSDDPTSTLVKFLSTDKSSASSSKFDDPKVDELFAKQASATDRAERVRLVKEFERYTMEKAYAVPFLWWWRITPLSIRVKGWTNSPSHMLYQDLKDVWLAPQ